MLIYGKTSCQIQFWAFQLYYTIGKYDGCIRVLSSKFSFPIMQCTCIEYWIMSEQKVDTIAQSSHQEFPITTTQPSRSVLADYSNQKCLQLNPDKTIVKQTESYIEQEGKIAPTKIYLELRPTTTSLGLQTSAADKNIRPNPVSYTHLTLPTICSV